MFKKVKVGLMLGGGGAKGAYQIGVIKALEEFNLIKQIDTISGVSIGAINTLLLMSRKKHKDIVDIWKIMDSENVFGTKGHSLIKEKRLYNFVPVAEKLIQHVDLKLVRKSRFNGFATAALMYDKQSFFHQIKTDTMEKEVFHLNKCKDPFLATMASASIPLVFGPTVIEGKNYVDGGVIDNYPIQPLIDSGCTLILAVALDDSFKPYIYDNQDINIINFTSDAAFEKNKLANLMDVMKFTDEFKLEKEEIGYFVAKTMIQKMVSHGYIKRAFGMTFLVRKEGFNVLELSKFDEMFVKNLKYKSRYKIRLMVKDHKKNEKIESRKMKG
jgi:NTE family protein